MVVDCRPRESIMATGARQVAFIMLACEKHSTGLELVGLIEDNQVHIVYCGVG